MVYGMSQRLGLVGYMAEESPMKPYSESTNEIIDEEVKKVVDECYEKTRELLESKKHLIEE